DACRLLPGVPEESGCSPTGSAEVGGLASLLEADDTAPMSESRSDNLGLAAALAGVVGTASIAGA
ncbi:MAG: hypothetical protein ACE5FA_12575, partial [Dehalococcoidia bacterium]